MEDDNGNYIGPRPPRADRLSWDDHHMLMALVTAQRSPDPNTQVGACIVDKDNLILGTGYNAFPRGVPSNAFPWDRQTVSIVHSKYPYVVHAEKNAISNALGSVEGGTLYVTMYPCNECAKDIIQAGIKEIVYLTNPYEKQWQTQTSKSMLDVVQMRVRSHTWKHTINDVIGTLATLGVK